MRGSKPFISVLAVLLLALISFQTFAQNQSVQVDVTGEVIVEIADFFDEGRSELYYFIIDRQNNTRTQVFFQGQPDAAFTSGARVVIQGISRGASKGVDVQTFEIIEPAPGLGGAAIGGDDREAVVATPQTRKVLTLIVDFLDAVVDTGTSNAVTPTIVSNQMFNDPQNVKHFYDKASLGSFTIPTDPNGIGKEAIFGPYTINYNYLVANGGTCDANGWANAALTAWEADTVANPTSEVRADYDSWSIIVPNYWDYSGRACTWGGYAGVGCTQCWAFSADPASILFGVVNHELGHNFGFGHANSDVDNDGNDICGYCDESDQMGSERLWMNFNAPHLEFQGWWDPDYFDIVNMTPSSTQVEYDLVSVDEDNTYWLDPRAVKTARTGSTNYYFSYRQQAGLYDEVTPSYTTGVNIHWANSSFNNNYMTNFYRIIEAGQVFEDPAQDLLVWGVGTTQVDDGQGNIADAFTIRVCNSTCGTLWPALGLSAAGAFPDTIQLNWSDYTYSEDGFEVEYSPDGSTWSALDTTAADATAYLHTGLTGGSTFFYRVRAYRGAGEFSEWSNSVSATTPAASGVIELHIATGDDDVMETTSSGSIWLTSPANFLDYDTWNSRNVEEGLRFRDIPIPKGSTINSAYIEYRTYNSGSGTNTVTFRAEDTDDAAIFTSATNSVTSRTLGTASVNWVLSSWSGSTTQQSQDLTNIVQPIVDRAGWSGGNAMVFVTESDYSGIHNVYSYEGSQGAGQGNNWSPKLVIDYSWSATGENEAPTASFTFNCVDLDCTFTDTSTDTDGTIATWAWDFGDTNTSSAQSPAHTFAAYGTYNVSLTVTDDDGEPDSIVMPVTAHPVIRGPYLQTLTEDSVIVRWRTSASTDSVVRFGLTEGALSSTTTVAGSFTEHTVELTGLSPSTEYFYSIGDTGSTFMGDAGFHFKTAPVAGMPTPTRFWVIGDSGTANANARAVRDRYKEYETSTTTPSDFMLMLGDNAYNDGTDEQYQAAVFETYPELLRRLPVWPTLGNHDGYTADSDTQSGPYYDIFDLPTAGEAGGLASGTEAYYAFDYGNIHFIVLESYETDRSTGGAMLTWLESDLALNDKPWVIAFWHHPPYTKGSHDSDSEVELIDMRQNALPILEAWGVDLVMTGHSHSYERSMLIDSHYDTSDTLDIDTMIKDIGDGSVSGDGAYEKPDALAAQHEGAVYAVAGSSGKTSGTDPDWPHPVMIDYRVQLGSMVIDVNGNTLDAIFLDNTGVVQDDFTITKVSRNLAPYANPGPDLVIEDSDFQVGESVTLDGSASSDGDGSIVSYNWTWTSGSASGVNPTVNLPDGVTAVTLTVTDNDGATDGEIILITIRTPGVVEVRVSQSSDDAEELTDLSPAGGYSTGHITTTSSDLEMVEDLGYHGGDQTIGIRFQNLQIPQGATIRSASLVLNTDETTSVATTINIQAEDVDNAVTFNATSGNISGRPVTTASVPWSPGSWDATNVDHPSPDIAPVIQEVISRGGWTPGNSMALILTGTGKRVAESYDGSAGREPLLNIEFNIPPTADAGPDQLVADSDTLPGENVTLDGSGSSDPVGSIVSYDWTWAGGSDSGVSPTISLPDGTTVVTLTVTDDNGSTDVDTVSITVEEYVEPPNVDPVASFSFSCTNFDCNFTDLSTDSDGSIVTWLWDFGDGNTSNLQNPTHAFLSANTYTVTLTVTDNDAGTDNTNNAVTVSTPKLQTGVVMNVSSAAWTTVNLQETYTSMVVVGNPSYDGGHVPAVVRIGNVTASSFDVRVVNPGGAAISGIPVHYMVVEEGVYTEAANDIKMEAVKVTSSITGNSSNWIGEAQSYSNSYSSPVVVGQVMSYNGSDWSVFWASANDRSDPPSSSELNVGKHVAQDSNTTRANETLGYIVIETGSGSIEGIDYSAAVGGDTIQGIGNGGPFPYTLTEPVTPGIAIVSAAAMDGTDGGWPILFGDNPVVPGTLNLAFDEDTIGDSERDHTTEQVAYLVFDAPPCSVNRSLPASQWVDFSLPCSPQDARVGYIFKGGPQAADYNTRWVVYHYDANTPGWVRMGVDDTMIEGKGYIYYALDAYASVSVSGDFNTGAPIPLAESTVSEAWNLIGNPYTNPVDWTSISIDDGASSYTWSQMDQQVDPDPYYCEQTPDIHPACMMWHVMTKWDGNVYIPYDGTGGEPGTLGVFESIWVRSHRADTITLPNPAGAPPATPMDAPQLVELASVESTSVELAGVEAAAKSRTAGKGKSKVKEWQVRLVVESGTYRDNGNWLGQAKKASNGLDTRDLEEWTPYSSPYLSILFTNPLFTEASWGYTRDIREPTRKVQGEWPFVVRASSAISEATLTWEGDNALFKNASLVDEVSGEIVDVNAGDSYTFTISEGEHAFRLIFE